MPTLFTSDAEELFSQLDCEAIRDKLPMLSLPGVSSVSHPNYCIGFQADGSCLVWAKGEGLFVFTCKQVYYSRANIEHLARCLGTLSRERRVELIGGEDRWIDGVHSAADGSWLAIA